MFEVLVLLMMAAVVSRFGHLRYFVVCSFFVFVYCVLFLDAAVSAVQLNSDYYDIEFQCFRNI